MYSEARSIPSSSVSALLIHLHSGQELTIVHMNIFDGGWNPHGDCYYLSESPRVREFEMK